MLIALIVSTRVRAFARRGQAGSVALAAGAAACVIDTAEQDELRAAVHQAVAWVFARERDADLLLS